MAIEIYNGKPSGNRLDTMLAQYGMFNDNGKAEYNDRFTLLFVKTKTKPVIVFPIQGQITRSIIESASPNLADIIEFRYSSNVVQITENAFEGCSSLSTVAGPYANNLWSIEANAFKNCTSLKTFEVDLSNVVDIDETAFQGCQVSNVSCKYPDGYEQDVWTTDDIAHARQMENNIKSPSSLLGSPMFAANRPTPPSGRNGKGKKPPAKVPPSCDHDYVPIEVKSTSNHDEHIDTHIFRSIRCRKCGDEMYSDTQYICPYSGNE